MIIIVVLVALGIITLLFFQQSQSHLKIPKAFTINTSNQPTMGNPRAKVHVVAFEDLKCSNCARFNNTLFPYIKKTYIDTGKAKYTMINLAFIQGSLPAANAARCIYHQKQPLFFSFVKAVYANQPPENEDWANIPKLLDYASKIPGVNTTALTNCLIQTPYEKRIAQNMSIANKVMNDQVATPSIYINGILVRPLSKKRFDLIMKLAQEK